MALPCFLVRIRCQFDLKFTLQYRDLPRIIIETALEAAVWIALDDCHQAPKSSRSSRSMSLTTMQDVYLI
jgi:hypothetical protein